MGTPARLIEAQTLTVRLFGVPHVSFQGRPVRFIATRTMPLFAYLLLNRGRPVARDLLAYAFWPDGTEDEARANLRRHINRINEALPRIRDYTWLETDNKTVAVADDAPIDLDVALLEGPAAEETEPQALMDLYRGDLYEGCDDEWIIAPRERLRFRFLDVAAKTVGRYRGERRYAEALALLQRMLQIDPFREDAVRTAMTLRYESGDRAGALREFAAFRDRLRNEVAAEPMHATQALHDAIRRHAPLETPAVRESAVERALPFEGRDDEVATLRDVWQHAARGAGRPVFLCGEAGIGKTRLLREFATLAEREGARLLWGAVSAPEAVPYEPLVEAFRVVVTELATLPLAPGLLGALAARFPEIRALRTDLPEIVRLSEDRERLRFFDAVALALAALAQRRPTVLIVEDLHWAQAGTLELVAAVLRTCAKCPFLAIITYREEEVAPPLRVLLGNPELRGALRLGLARLTPAACTAILQRGFAGDPLPADVSAWAARLSGGNPLFLSELARDYRARPRADHDEPSGIPPSLASTILARLARVPVAARGVAEVAAAAGSAFALDVVHRASGLPLAEVLDAVDDLVDRFIIRETEAGSHADFQFTHELIRDAMLGQIPAARRARSHRRLARTLLELFPERLDELARALGDHFEKAGLPRDAARYYARAAFAAHAQFAWQEAIAFARRSMELDDSVDARFDLLACIASAHATLGNVSDREDAIAGMLHEAERRDDDGLRAEAFARRAECAARSGDGLQERAAIDMLVAIAERTAKPHVLREARRAEARRFINEYTPGAAAEAARSIDGIPHLERSTSERVADLYLLAHAETDAENFEAARETALAAERLALAGGGVADRLSSLRALAKLAFHMGDRAETKRLAEALLDLCHGIGDVEGEANAHLVAERAAWWSFDVASARRHLHDGIAITDRIGNPRTRALLINNAGSMANNLGLFDEAERRYAWARQIAESIDAKVPMALCSLNFSYTGYVRGEPERSLEWGRRGLREAREAGDRRLEAIGLTNCGAALRELGRTDEACAMFSEALAICEELNLVDDRREALVEFMPALLACGRLEDARNVAHEIAKAISSDPSAVDMPVEALARASAVLTASGDDAGAAALRERARTLLRQRLELLPDDETRAAYAAIRWHRPLLEG
jgi:DNA-binding SARP family transcriptional activator